jgi:adenine-specific DNA-methyltransferase
VNWPGVTLLKAQMNTDLLTEDLKKAASNQSFWLMGQPDVDLAQAQGRDVGGRGQRLRLFRHRARAIWCRAARSRSRCGRWTWITTSAALMPHQVFFPMADAKGGWNRLKQDRAAELDEDLLEQFHGTVSLPFEAGDNRRIAVKIVDDRGIESLKIMPLRTDAHVPHHQHALRLPGPALGEMQGRQAGDQA